ncbi:Protein ASP-1 protein7, partial [Aphelenchoides avenae]
VSGLVYREQKFAVADQLEGHFVAQPIDGLLGLGWPGRAIDRATPPFQNFAKDLDQPIFSIWLDHQLHYYHVTLDGAITFGALDTDHCQPQWDYVPVSARNVWQIEADS